MKRYFMLFALLMATTAQGQTMKDIAIWPLGRITLDGVDSTFHAAIYMKNQYPDSMSLFLFLKGDSGVKFDFRHPDSTQRRISVVTRTKYVVQGLGSDTVQNAPGRVLEDSLLLLSGMRVYRVPYLFPLDSLILDFEATLGPNIDTTISKLYDSLDTDITGFLRMLTTR